MNDYETGIRDDEASLLEAAWLRAASGFAGAVVLVGESGSGKSYLLDRFAAAVEDDETALVLRLDSPAGGRGARPFLPLLELVNDQWGELEMAGTVTSEAGAALAAAVRADAKPREILRLFDDLIGAACAAGPVLIAMDSPAVSAPMVSAVAHVVRRSRERPLLVVAAVRPDTDVMSTFTSATDALVLPIEPLTDDESRALVRERLGPDADAEVVERLVIRGAGNPRFLDELALAVKSTSAAGRGPAPTLRLLVAARLDHLSAAARAIVDVAALATRPLPYRLVALVAGIDPDDRRPLDEAVSAGILSERTDATLTFPNPVVPELVETATPRQVLRDLHERLARLLEMVDADPVDVAHHALAAARPGDAFADQAIDLALGAAYRTLNGANPTAAIGFAEAALALEPTRAREAELLAVLAEAQLHLGHVHDAVQLFERSLALDPTPAASLGLGRSLQRAGRLDAALDILDGLDGLDAARCRCEVLLGLGRTDEAWKAAQIGVSHARGDSSTVALASALADAALVEAVRGMPDAVPTAEEAVAVWRIAGEESLDWPPLFALGLALESCDRFAESLIALREMRNWLDRRGLLDAVPRVVRTETISAFLSLSWGRMEEALAAAIDVRRDEPNHEMASIWAAAATLAAARGDHAGWFRCRERSSAAFAVQTTPFDRALAEWWRGMGELFRSDVAAAATAFAAAADGFRRIGAVDFLARSLPPQAILEALYGDRALAERLTDEYAALAPHLPEVAVQMRQVVRATGNPVAAAIAGIADAYATTEDSFAVLLAAAGAMALDPTVVDRQVRARIAADAGRLAIRTDLHVPPPGVR